MPNAQSYKVEGKVAMGQGKDGKQPIQIDWNVIDPTGKKLGTVSQKNEVPQGSLDGAWGKTADAAAAAAAQGIIKLLPAKEHKLSKPCAGEPPCRVSIDSQSWARTVETSGPNCYKPARDQVFGADMPFDAKGDDARSTDGRGKLDVKIVAGNSNRPLADAICAYLKLPMTKGQVKRFADMEIFVEIQENVRGQDVFVIQSTSFPANDNMMELLILIDALKRSSARRITAVIPYFGYARQDRKPGPRTPISAKLVANLIERAGADRVLTLDLHAGQIQGFFDIPTDNLFAAPVMTRDIEEHFGNTDDVVVVSPDVGGVVSARALAKRIGAPIAICDKRRERPGESEVMNVIGDVDGKRCILIDDIVDSGGTLVNAAEALLKNGATEASAYISHGVLSGGAVSRIQNSRLKSLVITDSILPTEAVRAAKNIRVISIAPLIGEAIMRTSREESVSSLFY